MFARATTLSFFPTFVWVYDLAPEDAEPLNAAIMEKLEAHLHSGPRLGQGHSLQSATHLHELPEFQPLATRVLEAGRQILKFLEHEPSPMRITGCWANVSAPTDHHREHSHPNNFLSGAYYVRAPKGGDTINFHDPRPQAHVIAPRVTSLSTRHASSVNVDVTPGRLVLFPAWLRHSVDANAGQELRVSVAFNLMFESLAEDISRPRFSGQFLRKDETPGR